MADNPLITKSKEFALQIIKVCNYVKQNKKDSVLTNQLIRSGTNVGTNIRDDFYNHGMSDFIAKLQIALKECSKSEYWLESLIKHSKKRVRQIIFIKNILTSTLIYDIIYLRIGDGTHHKKRHS